MSTKEIAPSGMGNEVTIMDRFSEPLSWPIFAAFLAWTTLAVLFAIELGKAYFVHWHAAAIGCTVALGVIWLAWTALIIYDQTSASCATDVTQSASNQTTAKLRSAEATGTLWAAYALNTLFTVAYVIFVWLRLVRIEDEIDTAASITVAEDVYSQLQSMENLPIELLPSELELLSLAINNIFQIEASYVVISGVYSSLFSLMAFFAVTEPLVRKSHERTE